jgi:hypothetical protein
MTSNCSAVVMLPAISIMSGASAGVCWPDSDNALPVLDQPCERWIPARRFSGAGAVDGSLFPPGTNESIGSV